MHFETRDVQTNFMYIFAEPVTEEQVEEIQSRNDAKIAEFEQSIFGLEADKLQNSETGWADIEASVQEALHEDEMSLNNPEDGKQSSTPDGGVFRLNTGEGLVGGSHTNEKAEYTAYEDTRGSETSDGRVISEDKSDISRGDVEQVLEKGVDHERVIEENTASVNDFIFGGRLSDASSIAQDGGGTGSSAGKIHREEAQDLFSKKFAEQVGLGVNQGADLARDNGVRDIENGVPEMLPLESIKSSAVGTEPTEYKEEQHYGNSNQDEGHQQGHALIASQHENTNFATSKVQTHKPELDSQSSHEPHTQADNIDLEQINVAEKSNSKADTKFLESIETEPPPELLDIFAMVLTIRNKVNGIYTTRPVSLKPEDKWEVEYSLAEVPDQTRASKLYKACHMRRKNNLDAEQSGEKNSPFFQALKRMSQQGAFWRKKIDTEDKGKPKIVLTDSVVKQKGKETEED